VEECTFFWGVRTSWGINTTENKRLLNWEDDQAPQLTNYSVKKQDIEEVIHGISLDLRDLEGELFNIKIWHEINVTPMKSYIEIG
jgi:hypothetical protein